MSTETTTWQTQTGKWDEPASWTNGVPHKTTEPTVAILDGTLSQKSVRSGMAGASAARLITKPGYVGDIGGPGNPLTIDLGGGRAVLRGRGRHYIKLVTSYGTIIGDSQNLRDAGVLDGSLKYVLIKEGSWRVAGTAVLASGRIVADGSNAEIWLDNGIGGIGTIIVERGRIFSDVNMTASILVLGGLFEQRVALDNALIVAVSASGVFRYEPDAAPGSQASVYLLGGYTELTGAKYAFNWPNVLIGRFAEVGEPSDAPVFPPTGWTDPIDLRKDYP